MTLMRRYSALGAALLAGLCACNTKSACDDQPANCSLGITVLTRRLSKAGGEHLDITAPGIQASDQNRVTIHLTHEEGPSVTLPLSGSSINEDKIHTLISATDLAGLATGKVSVSMLVDGNPNPIIDKDLPEIRLYSPPIYILQSSKDFSVSPAWLGLQARDDTSASVYVLEQSAPPMPIRRLNRYDTRLATPDTSFKFSMYESNAGSITALTADQIVFSTPDSVAGKLNVFPCGIGDGICRTKLPLSGTSVSAVAADPQGDLAVILSESGVTVLRLAADSKSFVSVTLPAETPAATQIAVSESRGALRASVALLGADRRVTLIVQEPNGSLKKINTTVLLASAPVAFALTDVDADGLVDLAFVTRDRPTTLQWHPAVNNDTNTADFLTTPSSVDLPAGEPSIDALAFADLNGDGVPDLASRADKAVRLYVNKAVIRAAK